MKKIMPILLVAIAVCGCSQTEEKLNALEEENRALMAKLDSIQEDLDRKMEEQAQKLATPAISDKLKAEMDAQIRDMALKAINEQVNALVAEQSGKINDIVAAQIEEQIGKPEEISSLFQEVVDETMKEAEEKKQEEREKRQKEWTERREQDRVRRREDEVAKMTEKLKLNDDQVEKMREVLAKQEEIRRSTMRGGMQGGGGMAGMPDRMDKLAIENDSAMREVLNEEQFQVYQAEQEQKYNWMYNIMGRGGRPRIPYTPQQ